MGGDSEASHRVRGEHVPPEAVLDFYYLLNRGYPRKSSAQLVAARYGLLRRQVALLQRCVHEESYNSIVKPKLQDPRTLPGFEKVTIVVDVYNTTSLIMEASSCWKVYKCTDHVLRDNASAESRSWKRPEHVSKAFDKLGQIIAGFDNVEGVILVGDSQVPHSAVAMNLASQSLESRGVPVLGRLLSPRADKTLLSVESLGFGSAILLTSDRLLLEKARRVMHPSLLLKIIKPEKLVDLRRIVEQTQSL